MVPVTETAAIEPLEPVEAPHVRPAWAPLTLVAFVGLVICSNVASAVWARWVNTNPEGLLLLSSRNRYLALTLAAGVSVRFYIIIGFARVAAAFIVCHLVGRASRDNVVGWFTKYLGLTKESLDAFDKGFDKAEWLLIPFFAGSNIVAALSGVKQTPPLKLVTLLSIGIAGRLTLMWWLARTFEDQLVDFLGWLQRYQWWAVGISVGFSSATGSLESSLALGKMIATKESWETLSPTLMITS
jgi:uncharacterized membrane protein YuzA (DUF378 family)